LRVDLAALHHDKQRRPLTIAEPLLRALWREQAARPVIDPRQVKAIVMVQKNKKATPCGVAFLAMLLSTLVGISAN
jgi:hypothetical protein